ncbi:hypothetical protein D0T84_15770 [Dysgonomonas sp. 521]|uniref:ligand-binding sensor domain-containing protein n=1 Tax=Dysgonomonas sp. 521 TaxID=2302932 RepID=UPI0013D2167D|nr:two-component regulator propeller domain-containing protein [Dysgonomonas sp. 521]NDV96361.1 hypothetical protein [Dysgonomonas sp. 521]
MKKILVISCFLIISLCIQAQWTNMQIEPGISPKNDILTICFDKQGDIWAATSFGVYKYDAGQWKSRGPENIYVQSLFIDNNDTKWAGVWGGGVYKHKAGKEWENAKEASLSISTNAIMAGNKGDLWIGTWDKGLALFDGGKWINYKAKDIAIGDNSILSLAKDDKNIWVGTYHGLSSYDGSSWTLYNRDNSPLPDNDIYALCAGKNSLWIGSCNGLASLTKGKWLVYPKEEYNIQGDVVLAIAEDTNGNVWVGTNKGLTVFNGKNKKTYTMGNSNLIENRIQTIKIYNNKVYAGTSLGISMLDLSEFSY